MNELVTWLQSHNVESPHLVPDELKDEFNEAFSVNGKPPVIIWPQPGGQTEFLSCEADIVLYGGEAGGGKSWSLVFDHAKWVGVDQYDGVIVRKNYSDIFGPRGLWAEAESTLGRIGGKSTKGDTPKFVFDTPDGGKSTVYFRHCLHASKVREYWQGLAGTVISIDELTHFTKEEFTYIMGRNRSVSGVKPYMRCTCNPDPHSWVRDWIDWWIDDDGYIIPERCGVIRYFLNVDDQFVWYDSPEDAPEEDREDLISFTFIRGHLADNKKMVEADPGYKKKMRAQSAADKRALCDGNWNELDNPDAMFTHANFNKHRIQAYNPDNCMRIVIGIDPAGTTNNSSDMTGIVICGKDADGIIYVLDDKTGKYKPDEWAKVVCDLYDTYKADKIVAEANYGGQMVENTIVAYRALQNEDRISDIHPKLVVSTKGKHIRAEPVAMLYSKGVVRHVGRHMKELEKEMAKFVPNPDVSPNRLDALVFAVTELGIKQPKKFPRIRQL